MSERHDPHEFRETPSERSVLVQIEQLCDEFERAWKSGERPQIEQFLTRTTVAGRRELLTHLLEVEVEVRSEAGEVLGLDEYCDRFPAEAERVETVFCQLGKCRILGDYALLRKLGHGGMGEVYRARQLRLNQLVAIKVLPESCRNEWQSVARFQREMQSIGALNHPNIVGARDAREADGVPFLVMEHVDGVDLQQLVEDRLANNQGPLDVGAACEVLRQAALGLQHAHSHGLVHRDIKPANLMLSLSGTVKILDFGLARSDTSQLTEQLSQEGMAIGTVDYMAPEQAEHSSAVDIRADIYSLGCTLCFLLTGQPPYGNAGYSTIRKKLLAHAVAPIPSLLETRPDCSEDLDHILGLMLAKEPDERFDSPDEVADAIGLFADPAQLKACLADAVAVESSGVASTPGINSADLDTAQRAARRSQERWHSAKRRWQPGPWHQRPVPLASLSFGVVLVVILIIWAVNRPWRTAPAVPDQGHAQSVAADLALLPGLNGQWWFDEMPWYVPFVRHAVAETGEAAEDPASLWGGDSAGYLDPNVAQVQRWLWDVVTRSSQHPSLNQRRLVNELKVLADANVTDAELPNRLEQILQQFVDSHGGPEWPAADLHTRALLQHKLATLRSNRTLAEAAQASYESALQGYARTDGPNSHLRLLCLADSALLWSQILGNYEEASQRFDKALPPGDTPVLFAAETRVAHGIAAAGAGHYADHLFDKAKELLKESKVGKRSHPLAARACEGYAWSLMDQWKVDDAAKQFQEAFRIRSTNQKDAENPFAAIYVFHNRHGTAIAQRYRGNSESARRVFKTLVGDQVLVGEKGSVGEIQAALNEGEQSSARSGQQRYLRNLRERWANSMERWADCELYGGAASGAPVNLARACALYQKAGELNKDLDLGTKVVMACKLCIALALHGRVSEARQVRDGPEAGQEDVLGPDQERAELLQQVADAVLQLKADEQDPTAGQKSLRGFLDQFQLNPAYTDSSRRETLELQLFCAELLLSSELDANQLPAAHRDLKYLDPLLAVFRGRKDMRPFLRRYYELAIRACDRNDLVQVAKYLRESRAVESQETLHAGRATLLLFHFTPHENFAIVLPQDGRAGQLIPLDFNRQQIKEAASRGQQLRLNEPLVRLVQDEVQAGRSIETSWCDTMCWASEDEGLSDADWQPFRDQLDLLALRKAL
ncbi:MAG: serine/threonine-protein kinase [Planctomycetota bacterium]|nr:serine/threonine-protein kinase [Planctomycetota bacterium]